MYYAENGFEIPYEAFQNKHEFPCTVNGKKLIASVLGQYRHSYYFSMYFIQFSDGHKDIFTHIVANSKSWWEGNLTKSKSFPYGKALSDIKLRFIDDNSKQDSRNILLREIESNLN